MNEEVRSLISDKAVALMKKSLKDKGFIGKRGFKRLISLFIEILRREDGNHWASIRNLVVLRW